jgi:predicted DNA-binding transcriptional regulator AlpA
MSDLFLTEIEVSRVAKISLATLRRWRLEKRGPRFRKFGSLVRYSEEDLANWMKAQPSGGDAPLRMQPATEVSEEEELIQ